MNFCTEINDLFDHIYKNLLLLLEGKDNNDPNDTGGFTTAGISFKFFKTIEESGKNNTDSEKLKILQSLTPEEKKTITQKYFWQDCVDLIYSNQRGNAVLLALFFIMSFNMGMKNAVKGLQITFNEMFEEKLTVDGIAGVQTRQFMRRLNNRSQKIIFTFGMVLVMNYEQMYRNFNQPMFLNGWINRIKQTIVYMFETMTLWDNDFLFKF